MKFTKRIKGITAAVVVSGVALLSIAVAQAVTPGSIQYKGADTVGPNFAALNVFYDVPSVGNEADFVRVKRDGEANSALKTTYDTVCKTGDRFDVWFYVHNGANPSTNLNGTGPGVAKNTVAKVNLPQGEQTSLTIGGGVTSDNAQAINDTATINCGGKKFKVELVKGSGTAFLDLPNKTVALPDAIAAGGTPIGTNALDGSLWGCWEQRVWMGMKVVVTEVTEPVVPPTPEVEHALTCTLEKNQAGLMVGVAIQPTAKNVTIKSYSIDFGDGTVVNERTASHTYKEYKEYKIVGTVKGVDEKGKDYTANCDKTINIPKPDMKLVCKMLIKTNVNAVGAAIDASGSVNIVPASVTYSINFNDGTVVNAQTATHTYADYGKHVVTGTVKGTGVDGTKFTANCEDTFTSEKPTVPPTEPPVPPEPPVVPPVQPPVPPQPPVVPPTTPPPTTMPATGAASMVGLVSAMSVLGAIGHRAWIVRRVQ